MNDTTRNVLVDKVADVIQEAAVESSGVEDVWQWPGGWHTPINLAANEIIALVTAARDAEIREALLSDEAIVAGFRATSTGRPSDFETRMLRANQMAALAAIGLGDSDTGGQG